MGEPDGKRHKWTELMEWSEPLTLSFRRIVCGGNFALERDQFLPNL